MSVHKNVMMYEECFTMSKSIERAHEIVEIMSITKYTYAVVASANEV